jgi:hypothetical protein
VLLAVGMTQSDLAQSYASVRQVGLITCKYCQPQENNLPVYLCTQPKALPSAAWPSVKHLN